LSDLSSLDVSVLAAELDEALRGSRISNIYQLNEKTLLLKLRKPGGLRENLLIEAGRELHLTVYVFEKPIKPPDFCMALRKYLRNGKISRIQQVDFERIVEFTVDSRSGEYRLVIELFGEGNVILVDPENKILHALTYRRMKDRDVVRGEVFKYPPPRGKDPREVIREDLEELRKADRTEVVRSLARLLGIGGKYAEEILARAGVEKSKPSSSLRDEEIDLIHESLLGLLSEASMGKESPSVFIDEKGGWVDVAPIEMKKYSDLKRMEFESFNRALDEFYAKLYARKKTSEVKEAFKAQIERLERILKDQEETLRRSREQAEKYRRIGEAIYLHFNELQYLLQRIMNEKRSGRSWDEIREMLIAEKEELRAPAVYFEDLNPKALTVRVFVEDLVFDLDLRNSAQSNAARYYERAKKAERRARGAEEALNQTRRRIEELKRQRVVVTDQMPSLPPTVRRREWYEKFRWFHSSDGFLVIGGRDQTQNEIIFKKHTEPDDIVFHAEIIGAPLVVLKTAGNQPQDAALLEAAQFAASYSRAWKEGLGAVDVYWVKPDQVSKSPPSGEYLSKGAFMIRGSRNYVRGVPLEIAIGLVKDDDEYRVVGGPPQAIAKQTRILVRVVPGKEPSGRLAKRIKDLLMRMLPAEERDEARKISIEEIQRFIPSGRGRVSGK
jgi:predicted ribosome quality control (RQC) complex YloA/Tae2 family protein